MRYDVREFEFSYPDETSQIVEKITPLIKDALNLLVNNTDTHSIAEACLILLGYLMVEGKSQYRVPNVETGEWVQGSYRGEYGLVAQGIKSEIEKLIPPSIPPDLKRHYVREIASTLTNFVALKMTNNLESELMQQRNYPFIFYFGEILGSN